MWWLGWTLAWAQPVVDGAADEPVAAELPDDDGKKKKWASIYGGVGVPKLNGGFGFRGHLGFAGDGKRFHGGAELSQNSFGSASEAFSRSRFVGDFGWKGKPKGPSERHPVFLVDYFYDSFGSFGTSSFSAIATSRLDLMGGMAWSPGVWHATWMGGIGRQFGISISDTDASATSSLRLTTTGTAERPVMGGFGTLKLMAYLGSYQSVSLFDQAGGLGLETGAMVNLLAMGLSEKLTPGAFVSTDVYTQPASVAVQGGVSFRGGF